MSVTINEQQMMAANEGFLIAHEYFKNVTEAKDVIRMCQPMQFKKLRGKEHTIKKQTADCWEVASMRHAVLFGVKALRVNYGKPTTFHELHGPRGPNGEGEGKKATGVLTSDKPVEIYSQAIEFMKMSGRVLVGGLGLGMAARMIFSLPSVRDVTVVEYNKNLIDFIWPQISTGYAMQIVHSDLYRYLKSVAKYKAGAFDSAYLDIWYGTGEATWASTVVPLLRLCRKAGIENCGAWGEHEMRGQMISSLYTRTQYGEDESQWKPYRVFIEALKKRFGKKPPYDVTDEARKREIVELIKFYIERVGFPDWEATFDWDGVA